MKRLDGTQPTASLLDGELPTGSYVLSIVDMFDCPQKEYVVLVYDIAEGPYKGYYSTERYKRANSYHSHCCYLSYKSEYALAHTRACMVAITRSNDDFDASAKWDALVDTPKAQRSFRDYYGKVFGADIVDDDYYSHDVLYHQKKVDVYTTADYVRNGTYVRRGGYNA